MDVAQVEVRLEEAVVEPDGALVERLRLGQVVAGVADIGQVDERRHQVGLVVQGPPISARRLQLPLGAAVVEQGAVEEVLLGARERARAVERDVGDRRPGHRHERRLARERDDARRLGVEPEVERELPFLRELQIAERGPERHALLEFAVDLPEQAEILEGELRAAPAPLRRRDEAPLLQVAHVVFAQRGIHAEHVARTRRRHGGRRKRSVTGFGRHRRSHHGECDAALSTHLRRGAYNTAMILAADVGGSKTLVGLFERARPRPHLVEVRSLRTLDFAGLPALLQAAMGDVSTRVNTVALGVAGPIRDGVATMTNVPWRVSRGEIAARHGVADVRLLNDLEAMAHAVTVLHGDELHTLQAGRPSATGNAALIAAGTGLGEAILHRVDGRLRPVPSEAGHADFAARTDGELALVVALRARYGRADIEHVVSGPGMVNIARHTHGGADCAVAGALDAPDAAARVSAAGAGPAPACPHCVAAVDLFVSAYGAEAGNLALRAVASAGVYVGGGIAPKLLPALQAGAFLRAFTDKAPMAALLADVPVHVILNDQAGLVGAAVAALEPAP